MSLRAPRRPCTIVPETSESDPIHSNSVAPTLIRNTNIARCAELFYVGVKMTIVHIIIPRDRGSVKLYSDHFL